MAEKRTDTKTPRARGQNGAREQTQGRRGRGRAPRNESFTPREFEQKLLKVSRVSRMKAGGRRFSFRAAIVIGDRAGRVGVGVAKGGDVAFAVEKATRNAKKNLFTVAMTSQGSIPHEVTGKQTSARVLLKPARVGHGIIAGGSVRVVCDLAGYKDISGKILSRSTNRLNNALATVKALKTIRYTPGAPKNELVKEMEKESAE